MFTINVRIIDIAVSIAVFIIDMDIVIDMDTTQTQNNCGILHPKIASGKLSQSLKQYATSLHEGEENEAHFSVGVPSTTPRSPLQSITGGN